MLYTSILAARACLSDLTPLLPDGGCLCGGKPWEYDTQY